MLSTPRVLRLLRSPRPESEWHSGELETGLVLALRPELVRRGLARTLPPAWVDFRGRLKQGARRFRDIDRKTRGYFGWPAMARRETAVRVMRVRGRLTAAEVIRAHGPRSHSRKRSIR
jgi:creatinine amidohydrolase/Fe(II)-dependent formamide hydrolase-like protein